jgi:ribosomal protein L7/L12
VNTERAILDSATYLINALKEHAYDSETIQDQAETINALRGTILDLRAELASKDTRINTLTTDKEQMYNQLRDNSPDVTALYKTVRSFGPRKIDAIKEVRSITSWGLKAAKDFVELVNDGKPASIQYQEDSN